ncbi:amidohydrolase family protein [Chloroflexota bacterium]
MTQDCFVIDCEAHLLAGRDQLKEIAYFPTFKRFMQTGSNAPLALAGTTFHATPTAEGLIEEMDASGVDMTCVLPEKMTYATGETGPISTNGLCLAAVRKYPDRLVMCPNFGPIIKRGVDNAIWEMEYMAKERGVKYFKFYPPEDTFINDERLWPFFAKAQELELIMAVHTGMNLAAGGHTKYCHPLLLEDVCNDFWDLRIIAFHFGWPFNHELNVFASTFPNLYIGMSVMVASGKYKPHFFQHIVGEAIQYAGVNKLCWGTDWPGISLQHSLDCVRDLQIDEELQKNYGYAPISEDDKAKMLGLNLAGLLGIEPAKKAKASTS